MRDFVCAENISLQENSRFIPVRPILRRNVLHDDLNDPLSGGHNLTNPAAIGVVIPTTPNTVNDTPVRSTPEVGQTQRIPDGSGQILQSHLPQRHPAALNERNLSSIRGNIEERLSQIQDYIQITSGLISSIRTDKVSFSFFKEGTVVGTFVFVHSLGIFEVSREDGERGSNDRSY